jgi:hypothetical protein
MEDEAPTRPELSMALTCQGMLSELWIGSVYETVRLLKVRKLVPDGSEFLALAHDLKLLRIPMEKHELPSDWDLEEPLQMRRQPPNNDATDIYEYDKGDPKRAHIMPWGLSPRGSLRWHVLDIKTGEERWIERRELSDRLLSLWETMRPNNRF